MLAQPPCGGVWCKVGGALGVGGRKDEDRGSPIVDCRINCYMHVD